MENGLHFVYASDTKKRYIHIYYSAAKAVDERARLEEKIHEMQRFMEQHEDKEYELDRHSISIFICIITRKTDILFMANPSCR